jgi:hypothetical protein
MTQFEIKDSGAREEFETGSRRDTREGKGRFDLIPSIELRRLAAVYEKGAKKYGDGNWQKGQPLSRYYDSAVRHLICALEGQEDEDHLMHAAWNCFAFAWTQRAIREGRLSWDLWDLPEMPSRWTTLIDPTTGKTEKVETSGGAPWH